MSGIIDMNQPKRGRSRPRKNPPPDPNAPKRPRGRPKKTEEVKQAPPVMEVVPPEEVRFQTRGTKYRTEDGVRKYAYKRFKPGIDYQQATSADMIAALDMELGNIDAAIKRGGKTVKYESAEEFLEACRAYLEYLKEANKSEVKLLPSIEGFASFAGFHRSMLADWERGSRGGMLSDAVKIAKNAIASAKMQLGMSGKIPPIVLAMDMNNNHGYTQKQELVVTPKNPLGDEVNPEEIAARYQDYPED